MEIARVGSQCLIALSHGCRSMMFWPGYRFGSSARTAGGVIVERPHNTLPFYALLRHLVDHHIDDECYGLELLQSTGLDEGTLCSNLKRMARAGWLTSRPEDEHAWLAGAHPGRGPGRRRTYYSFTPEGRRAALHELEHHTFRDWKKASLR
jgi:DNA-binding MarR family transcriptional regulator